MCWGCSRTTWHPVVQLFRQSLKHSSSLSGRHNHQLTRLLTRIEHTANLCIASRSPRKWSWSNVRVIPPPAAPGCIYGFLYLLYLHSTCNLTDGSGVGGVYVLNNGRREHALKARASSPLVLLFTKLYRHYARYVMCAFRVRALAWPYIKTVSSPPLLLLLLANQTGLARLTLEPTTRKAKRAWQCRLASKRLLRRRN